MIPRSVYRILKAFMMLLLSFMFPLFGLLLITIYSIHKFRKNKQILVVVLFISTYSIPFLLYGYFDIYLSFYTELFNPNIFLSALKIHTLFNCVLFVFLSKNAEIPVFRHSSYILYYISIVSLLFFILGPTKGMIFNSETYGEITNSRIFGIPAEYGIGFVFFLLAFDSKSIVVSYLLILLFCLKYLALGMRVAIIEVALIFIVTNI